MQFSITYKICPICKIKKSIEEFDKYFSKERKKYRIGNYCKLCARTISVRRKDLESTNF